MSDKSPRLYRPSRPARPSRNRQPDKLSKPDSIEDTTWSPSECGGKTQTTPPREHIPVARLLAEAGLGTRRKIALWLETGRLLVNDAQTLPGACIPEITRLTLDGRDIQIPTLHENKQQLRVIAYHKAVGELCSKHDPRSRPLVHKRLPATKGRGWISVGRLDYMTGGLLLFTNHGKLAYRLMHPSYQLKRVYVARVYGRPVDEALRQELTHGVTLDDGPACFTAVEPMHKSGRGKNTWLRVTLMEGRNREVRRLFEAVGLNTNHLTRIQYGPHHLSMKSRPGNWRELTNEEKQQLIDCTGLAEPDMTS